MKTKITKNILLGVSLIALIGILLGALDSITGALSFFNNDRVMQPFAVSKSSNFEDFGHSMESTHSVAGLFDVELHHLKKSFGRTYGDTTITLKYITLKNSRHQLEIDKNGLPDDNAKGSKAISAGYHQLESLHSIPFKKIDKNFWKKLLLGNVIIKTVLYSCIMLLIFFITKNAFKTTPFTYKTRNKFYFLANLMLLLVPEGWIFNKILSAHLLQNNYNIPVFFDPFNSWFLMGLLTLFIATIFDYGVRLQKEQDLTI